MDSDDCMAYFRRLTLANKRRAVELIKAELTAANKPKTKTKAKAAGAAARLASPAPLEPTELPLPLDIFLLWEADLTCLPNALRSLHLASKLLNHHLRPLDQVLDKTDARTRLAWFRRLIYRLCAKYPECVFRFKPRKLKDNAWVHAELLCCRKDADRFAKPKQGLRVCKYSLVMFTKPTTNYEAIDTCLPITVDRPEDYVQVNGVFNKAAATAAIEGGRFAQHADLMKSSKRAFIEAWEVNRPGSRRRQKYPDDPDYRAEFLTEQEAKELHKRLSKAQLLEQTTLEWVKYAPLVDSPESGDSYKI